MPKLNASATMKLQQNPWLNKIKSDQKHMNQMKKEIVERKGEQLKRQEAMTSIDTDLSKEVKTLIVISPNKRNDGVYVLSSNSGP